ncbi:hypothetical protein BKA69DRAFT_1122490 [Paraphysoderma sedebokerense]|nr:hypothetical protein BKA69DRAFT_1122490 [Paraphysoderma sedebokerense]
MTTEDIHESSPEHSAHSIDEPASKSSSPLPSSCPSRQTPPLDAIEPEVMQSNDASEKPPSLQSIDVFQPAPIYDREGLQKKLQELDSKVETEINDIYQTICSLAEQTCYVTLYYSRMKLELFQKEAAEKLEQLSEEEERQELARRRIAAFVETIRNAYKSYLDPMGNSPLGA